MGPKETMTVATEERGGGTLRRMILVLAAAALMAAMMAVSAMPAMAKNTIQQGQDPPGPPLNSGGNQTNVRHCQDFGYNGAIINTPSHGRIAAHCG